MPPFAPARTKDPALIPISANRARWLARALGDLERATDLDARLQADPIAFVRRYPDPADAEVAAVFASGLATGRVAGFWPTLTRIFALADQAGGPWAWVQHFGPAEARALEPLVYRWFRGSDLAILARTLGHILQTHGSLGELFGTGPAETDIGPALERGIQSLRAAAVACTGAPDFKSLPRAFRYLLPRPADGSACKRWNMLLRWMARPPGPHSPDLGLWAISPALLIIPLDTHVLRISELVGLTRRQDASWCTAVEITRALAVLDPQDPVRFDFALAHLGISGACRRAPVEEICVACGLARVCRLRETG